MEEGEIKPMNPPEVSSLTQMFHGRRETNIFFDVGEAIINFSRITYQCGYVVCICYRARIGLQSLCNITFLGSHVKNIQFCSSGFDFTTATRIVILETAAVEEPDKARGSYRLYASALKYKIRGSIPSHSNLFRLEETKIVW
jgi:hypothetical protein